MGNIFITGGSRGMGRAVALKFAREGHDVAITYEKNRTAAEEVVSQVRSLGKDALALAMDIGRPESIDAAFDAFETRFGKLDYLFNNVGIFLGQKPLADQTWQGWETLLRVNVIGQWYCTRRAVRNMAKNGGGSIVYNSSISGTVAFPGAADYAASKHAVVGMVKGHAIECAPMKIRVNGICPGFFKTDMFDEYFGGAAEYLSDTKIPARRIGTVEELAGLAYWLLVEGTYCYGENIVFDGGMTIGPMAVPE
ncbi:MAG: SDR family oxidoreductase [Deltaproteobacteria bacterium]|nr:MAG: SDR family oxidoreductase [Deltaproteobacteria bacterium]